MNYTLLTKVYNLHGIKKKRIKWIKVTKDKPAKVSVKEKNKMVRELRKVKQQGYKVVYIDETMFTRRSVPTKEYCLPSKNMTVD